MNSKNKSTDRYNAYVKQVADLFIKELKKGTPPWSRGWELVDGLPKNAISKKQYLGSNLLLLSLMQLTKGYKDPRWITFKQAQDLGGSVRKGEHGVPCIFWKKLDLSKEDSDGPTDRETENANEAKKERFVLIPIPFTVFNVEQCQNLNLPQIEAVSHDWTPIEAAERLLKASGAKIEEVKQDQAYYSPVTDKITLPLRRQFKSAEDYYDTALHELGHWTGHSSRLNRDMTHSFGTAEYAREELRAEISSFMTGTALGLPHNIGQHAAYIDNWIQIFKSDPKELFRACADAERIKNYIFSLDKNLKLHVSDTEIKTSVTDPKQEKLLQQASIGFFRSDEDVKKEIASVVAKQLLVKPRTNPYQFELNGIKTVEKGLER